MEFVEVMKNRKSVREYSDKEVKKEHIEKIGNADLSYPIWVLGNGDHVFDGVHRLVKAVVNKIPTIEVKYWTELPEEGKVE